MSEETAPDSDPAPEPTNAPQPPGLGELPLSDSPGYPLAGAGGQGVEIGEGAELEQGAVSSEPLPPRADRDRFGSLGKNVVNPDRTCLTCVVLVFGAILLLIGCGVYYYYANAAFHQP